MALPEALEIQRDRPISKANTTDKPIRTLVVSSLYPSAARPNHGVFVENRLRELVTFADQRVQASKSDRQIRPHVIAPVPWYPSNRVGSSEHRAFAQTPHHDTRHGIHIDHPRYLTIPKIGMGVQPWLFYQALKKTASAWIAKHGRPDLIDAHYVYPDGVAAALLARDLDLPLIITARGSDINQIPSFAIPRAWIRFAFSQANGLVAVCQALAQSMIDLGAPRDRVTVLRNGVDLDLFHPKGRQEDCVRWQVQGPTLLTVGTLIERKGIDLIIQAMSKLPQYELLIAGSGEKRGELEALARSLGLSGRVRFLGQVPHSDLPSLYRAADISVLASSREGWANVLLESMACGTPVVASNVWGTPEVVADSTAGRLMENRDSRSIVRAVETIDAAGIDRMATRRYAEDFPWDATSLGQIKLFQSVIAQHRAAS